MHPARLPPHQALPGPPGQLGPGHAARVGPDQGAHPGTRRVPLPVLRRPGRRGSPRARAGVRGRRLAGVAVQLVSRGHHPRAGRSSQRTVTAPGAATSARASLTRRARPGGKGPPADSLTGRQAASREGREGPPRGCCSRGIASPTDPQPGSTCFREVARILAGRMVDLRRHHRALAVGLGPACAPTGRRPERVTDNRTVTTNTCPGCGAAVPRRRGRGRPRRWCSGRCRSAESSRRARLRAAVLAHARQGRR